MEQNNNNDTSAQQAQQTAAQQTAPVAPQSAQQPAVEPQAPAQPVNAPDRTKEQFEKLLESNKRLYEANTLLRQEMEQSRTRPAQQQTQVPQQRPATPEVNPNDFVERDPITGESYINEQRLRSRIEEIQQRAMKAEQTIQSYVKTAEEREIERQNQEAFLAHPELEPGSEKFDTKFHKQVRGILADSMFNPDDYSGRPLSFKEAADFVRAQYPKAQPASDASAEQLAQSQAAQALKEQASSQANNQPRGAQSMASDDDLETLRYRTRYQNDDWALAKRLMHTEHIVPRDADEV